MLVADSKITTVTRNWFQYLKFILLKIASAISFVTDNMGFGKMPPANISTTIINKAILTLNDISVPAAVNVVVLP